MKDEMDMSAPVTRGELREELEHFRCGELREELEHFRRVELREELEHFRRVELREELEHFRQDLPGRVSRLESEVLARKRR